MSLLTRGNYLGFLKGTGGGGETGGEPPEIFLPTTTTGFWIADDLNILADSDPIGTWTDQVNDFAASASGADRPVLKKEIVNNKSVVRFTTSNELNVGNVLNIGTQSMNIFVVGSGGWDEIFLVKNLNGNDGYYRARTTNFQFYDGGYPTFFVNTHSSDLKLYEFRLIRGGTGGIWLNGVSQQPVTYSDTTTDITSVYDLFFGNKNLAGDIAMILVCQQAGDISGGDRTSFNTSITEYYGLTLS
jgi:hypothetical protein